MASAPENPHSPDRVIIAIDPHKASWTAVAVNAELAAVASVRVEVNRAGYRQLRRFAARWPRADWAIEGIQETRRAEMLGISPSTIDTYIERVRVKYAGVGRDAPTKSDLVTRALEDGLITLSDLGSGP